jgi:transcriptional regulator with XRE-family HTH domain
MIQDNTEPDLSERIARRVRELRTERGFSLDSLAARSGVSRSSISMIERAEISPTAVVLERLATGLDVPLASLFDPPTHPASSPVSRRADQTSWRDPQSGYLRRNVSPPGNDSPIRIIEVEFPPDAVVAYETADRDIVIHQQVWLLSGSIEVTISDETHTLGTGDCLSMTINQPITFRNPTARRARYAVVIVTDSSRVKRTS